MTLPSERDKMSSRIVARPAGWLNGRRCSRILSRKLRVRDKSTQGMNCGRFSLAHAPPELLGLISKTMSGRYLQTALLPSTHNPLRLTDVLRLILVLDSR